MNKEDKQYDQQDRQTGVEHEELSGSVVGAAIEVHKAPNGHTMTSWLPGFLRGPLFS